MGYAVTASRPLRQLGSRMWRSGRFWGFLAQWSEHKKRVVRGLWNGDTTESVKGLSCSAKPQAALFLGLWRGVTRRAVELLDDGAVGDFPDFDLAVPASRGDKVAVGTDSEGVDLVGVAVEGAHRGTGVGVPDADGLVAAAGDEQRLRRVVEQTID